jgi:hypothetical protein
MRTPDSMPLEPLGQPNDGVGFTRWNREARRLKFVISGQELALLPDIVCLVVQVHVADQITILPASKEKELVENQSYISAGVRKIRLPKGEGGFVNWLEEQSPVASRWQADPNA